MTFDEVREEYLDQDELATTRYNKYRQDWIEADKAGKPLPEEYTGLCIDYNKIGKMIWQAIRDQYGFGC